MLNCLHITPDIKRIRIDTIKELYPTITGEASPGDKNWFRRFLLPLHKDTICFYIGSFGIVNSLWLVCSDDFLVLIMSDWTD